MESSADLCFEPLPPIEEQATFAADDAGQLGPLAGLKGKWAGRGFNLIWRPRQAPGTDVDHFLELNLTSEHLEFGPGLANIPNRGLLQDDIPLAALSYVQKITDANVGGGLQHFEPGLWLNVPSSQNPQEGGTVARLACIPHGTTLLAQGTASTKAGPPDIPDVSTMPFVIGEPGNVTGFVETDLHHGFLSPPDQLVGITRAMVENPNRILHSAIAGQHIQSTTKLHVSTRHSPLPGGGTANIAFLVGAHTQQPDVFAGPNAVTAAVTATFWLETLQGDQKPSQLQYSQRVLLNFDGRSWPHVTVATLRRQAG
jgi:hypothetical protein